MKYQEKKLGRKRKGTFEKPIKQVKGFPAKYEGTCFICKNPIRKLEMIGWFAYGKCYHISCTEQPDG